MAGNSWGQAFRVTTFGESHGPMNGAVVDGCPPGLAIDEADLQPDLDRRRPGSSRFVSQRREADRARIVSGVFEGRTTGTPIGLLVDNEDARSRDYDALRSVFRPGHADYVYLQKYGRRDHRGSGRASARETVMRVAAGAIAKKALREWLGVSVRGCLSRMGDISMPVDPAQVDWDVVESNPFFCPQEECLAALEQRMRQLQRDGDSVGAELLVVAEGVPVGLGEPVFGRLDADVAAAMMSINAVKAVALGDGFAAAECLGSEFRDQIGPEGFLSNRAGGVLGGLSTGQPVVARVCLKPTSSIRVPGATVDVDGQATQVSTTGRHDPCVGLRATPIAEAMLAIVLMDHWLRHRGQNADVRSPGPRLPGQAPVAKRREPARRA